MPETGAAGVAGSGEGEPGMGMLMPMAGMGIDRGGNKLELNPGLEKNAGGEGRVMLVPSKTAITLLKQLLCPLSVSFTDIHHSQTGAV